MTVRLTRLLLSLLRFPGTRVRRARRLAMPRFAVLEDRRLLAAVLPVIDGFALDSNLDGTFDSVSPTGLVDVHKSTTSQATGLFEFAVPFHSDPEVITGLTNVKFRLYDYNAPQVLVYAYAGDGQLSLSDITAAGTLVATTTSGGLSNVTLPAGLLATLGNPTHIGFRVETNQGQICIYGVDQYPSNAAYYGANLEYTSVYATPQATLIDFNRLQHGGIIAEGSPYQGYPVYGSIYHHGAYRVVGGFSVYGTQSSQSTGSSAAASRFSTSSSGENYVLSRPDGLRFTLKSMKLSKDSADSPDATIVFTGTKADGTTVQQGGTADQLAGRLLEFAGFEDVVSVSWARPRRYYSTDTAPAYQFDDIHLESINPNTLATNLPPVLTDETITISEQQATGVIGQLTASAPEAGQTLTYTLVDGGAGLFTVSSTGVVTLTNGRGLDFESTFRYDLSMRVTDSGTPFRSDLGTVTIQLTDVVNDPQQTLTPVVDGDLANGVLDTTSTLMTVLGASVGLAEYDLSGVNLSQLRTAHLSVYVDPSGDLGMFRVYAYQGDGTLAVADGNRTRTYLGIVTPTGFGWQTIALDAAVLRSLVGSWSHVGLVLVNQTNIDPQLHTQESVIGGPRLTLGLWPNTAPVLNDMSLSLPEIYGGSAQLVATDADPSDRLTYTLVSSTLPGAFTLNSNGFLYSSNNALLDYETVPTVTLTVRVTDNGLPGLSDEATITINLTNQNETPVVSQLTINAGTLTPGALLGQVTATDADPTTLTYSIGNSGVFYNSTTGQYTYLRVAVRVIPDHWRDPLERRSCHQ